MTEKETETKTPPANQSPETMEEEVDLDQVIEEKLQDDGFVAKLKDKLGLGAPAAGASEPTKGTEAGAVGDAAGSGSAPIALSEPERAPAAPTPSLTHSVEDTVRKVLEEKDHRAEHEHLSEPPPPKPDRKGVAGFLFGKTRT